MTKGAGLHPKDGTRRAAWVVQLDLDRSRAARAPIGTLQGVATGRRQPIAGWAALRRALTREAGLDPPPKENA